MPDSGQCRSAEDRAFCTQALPGCKAPVLDSGRFKPQEGTGGTLYHPSANALRKLGGSCFCPLGRPELPPNMCPDGEATGRGTPWTPWKAEHPARCLPRARPSATTLPLPSESPDPGAVTAPRMFLKTETRHPVVLFKFLTQICEQTASPLFSALIRQAQAQVMKPQLSQKGTPPCPPDMPGICAVQLARFLRVRRKESRV